MRIIYSIPLIFAIGILFGNYADAQAPSPCATTSKFGCFEVGLPGSNGGEASAGKNIDEFVRGNDPIKKFINLIVTFVTGIIVIIAVITIVIGGYMYMTAAGNASQLSTAKEMITTSLIGIFLAFISVVILNTINPFLGSKAVEPTLGNTPSSPDSRSGAGATSGTNQLGNTINNLRTLPPPSSTGFDLRDATVEPVTTPSRFQRAPRTPPAQ